MDIRIQITWPRRLRVPRGRRARIVTFALAVTTVAVPAAWASHQFADVPETNPHHADVAAIRTAGITQGCNPPANTLYCPDHPVRRDQMASFLQRGLGRASRATGHVQIPLGLGFTGVATTTITVSGSGFLLANAASMGFAGSGCPCTLQMRLRESPSGGTSWFFAEEITSDRGNAVGNTWVFPVTAGTRTVTLEGRLTTGSAPIAAEGAVTAMWVPFGATGGGTLGDVAGAQRGGPR
jgi:hypothetical protein